MILHLNASSRTEGSASRYMSRGIVEGLHRENEPILHRDLSTTSAVLTDTAVQGIFLSPNLRSESQKGALALSDQLVDELEAADRIVLGTPIYNFGAPTSLKSWADQVARAGRTFRYESDGSIGLLKNKKVYVAVASGGTEIGSNIDFLTPWLVHFLRFIGLKEVKIVGARRSSPSDTEALDTAISEALS